MLLVCHLQWRRRRWCADNCSATFHTKSPLICNMQEEKALADEAAAEEEYRRQVEEREAAVSGDLVHPACTRLAQPCAPCDQMLYDALGVRLLEKP